MSVVGRVGSGTGGTVEAAEAGVPKTIGSTGEGRVALLFLQCLMQAQDVQHLLATRQAQAGERSLGVEREQVERLEQSQQRGGGWR